MTTIDETSTAQVGKSTRGSSQLSAGEATRVLVARARTAGLRLPPVLPGQEWRPSTTAEQHLLSEARRLDQVRQMLLAEIGRLRALPAPRPSRERFELGRLPVVRDCPATPGQLEALAAAAHGESVEATAHRCYVTVDTVKSQRRRAVAALGADTLTHAVALAVAAGWIPAGEKDGDES